jgi:SAM-dependent methyltransferase
MSIEADIIDFIDWNELWKKALLGASWRKREKDPVRFFDKKAKWYNQTVMSRTEYIQKTLARIVADYGCSILDIGSGPGTLAIPLAKTAGKVTAIDPSGDMLDYLKENARREGVSNITCINKKWEDVAIGNDIEPHDIVIASHSLTMMDIEKALSKIDEAANQRVYLFDFAGKPRWDYLELWPKLYGEPYVPGPNYIFIVNILYQMGITANVKVWEQCSRNQIVSLEEAVRERVEYYDSPLPDAEKIIREYIEKNLVKENGEIWTVQKSKSAMIWWKKTAGDQSDGKTDM